MKKTQFCIGLLSACLVSASSTFSSSAWAQSCGAETCDSGSCKCSKKHCDDTGLLEVINSAASNFEAGLASMIPDGSRVKPKAACKCKQCAASSHSHSSYAPAIEQPTIYQHDGAAPIPHVAPATPTSKSIPTPVPAPNFVPDVQSNPFIDEDAGQTRNLRATPARPANYLRTSNAPSIEYDPQARSAKPMRSLLVSPGSTKSISDAAFGLATTKSTRRPSLNDRDGAQQQSDAFSPAANVMAAEMNVGSDMEPHTTPEVVPASLNAPLPHASSLRSQPSQPATTETPMYVNPLRAE